MQPGVPNQVRAPKQLGVVVNPTAGKGRGAKVGDAVINRLHDSGHNVWNLSGRSADLALEHVKRAQVNGLDALVVVGGDGMVHLGIQAVAGTDTPLGVVPMGTGNDFATAIGLPVAEPTKAVNNLLAALDAGPDGVKAYDAIRACGTGLNPPYNKPFGDPDHGRWVAGAVSAGLDAAVNARANAMLRPKGSSRYILAALAELAVYKSWPYLIDIEQVVNERAELAHILDFIGMHDLGPDPSGNGRRLQWHSSGALVTAANSPIIGGGIVVAPNASVTDGYMDLVLAGDIGKAGAAKMFPEMMAGGKHANSKDVRIVRCRAVTIQPGQGTVHLPAAYADGEFLGTLPLHAELRPGALKILVAPH